MFILKTCAFSSQLQLKVQNVDSFGSGRYFFFENTIQSLYNTITIYCVISESNVIKGQFYKGIKGK